MKDTPPAFAAQSLLDEMARAMGAAPNLPPGTIEALDLASAIGHQTEEGRQLSLSIAVTASAQHTLPSEQRLAHPVATFGELRQLAVATNAERTCLRLEWDANSGAFAIVSIARRPDLSALSFLPKQLWTDKVLIEARGPASVTLQVGAISVRYEQGNYFTANAQDDLRTLAPIEVADALFQHCSTPTQFGAHLRLGRGVVAYNEEQYQRHRERYESELREGAALVAADAIYFIVEYANRLRHGATLLFVPDDASSARNVLTSRFALSASQTDNWNEGLLDYLWWVTNVRLAEDGISILKAYTPEDLFDWISSRGDLNVWRARDMWHRNAKDCAQLTQIDGVAVFDNMLRPRLIGAGVQDVNTTMLPDDWQSFLTSKGHRHRSGAYIANRLPGALSIVLSQDGTVTAFRSDRNGAPVRRTIRT